MSEQAETEQKAAPWWQAVREREQERLRRVNGHRGAQARRDHGLTKFETRATAKGRP